jgi:hypothetical protein
MFGKRAPLIFQKKILISLKFIFCSPFIKDLITEAPKKVKI